MKTSSCTPHVYTSLRVNDTSKLRREGRKRKQVLCGINRAGLLLDELLEDENKYLFTPLTISLYLLLTGHVPSPVACGNITGTRQMWFLPPRSWQRLEEGTADTRKAMTHLSIQTLKTARSSNSPSRNSCWGNNQETGKEINVQICSSRAWFITATRWEHPKSPSRGKWLNKWFKLRVSWVRQ